MPRTHKDKLNVSPRSTVVAPRYGATDDATSLQKPQPPPLPEQPPPWSTQAVLLLVVFTMVVGVANFTLMSTMYKAYGNAYAFYVNQAVNLGYVVVGALILAALVVFADGGEPGKGGAAVHCKYFRLGVLDAFGTFLTAISAGQGTPLQYQPLLNQSLIPLTMLFSVLILRVRYRFKTVLGALGILLGAVVTVLPPILFPARGVAMHVQLVAVLLYFSSNIPMAISAVVKEASFLTTTVDVWHLSFWVSTYQFLFSFLFIPVLIIPHMRGGMRLDDITASLFDGARCTFGITGQHDVAIPEARPPAPSASDAYFSCPRAYKLPFPAARPAEENPRGTFWLLLFYLLCNFTFNACGLLLTKHGSALLRTLTYALVLPLTCLASAMPFMGGLRESISLYTVLGLLITLCGFGVYQTSTLRALEEAKAATTTTLELDDGDGRLRPITPPAAKELTPTKNLRSPRSMLGAGDDLELQVPSFQERVVGTNLHLHIHSHLIHVGESGKPHAFQVLTHAHAHGHEHDYGDGDGHAHAHGQGQAHDHHGHGHSHGEAAHEDGVPHAFRQHSSSSSSGSSRRQNGGQLRHLPIDTINVVVQHRAGPAADNREETRRWQQQQLLIGRRARERAAK